MNAIFSLLNPNNTVTVNRSLAHAIGLNETIVYGALLAKYQYYTEKLKIINLKKFNLSIPLTRLIG